MTQERELLKAQKERNKKVLELKRLKEQTDAREKVFKQKLVETQTIANNLKKYGRKNSSTPSKVAANKKIRKFRNS